LSQYYFVDKASIIIIKLMGSVAQDLSIEYRNTPDMAYVKVVGENNYNTNSSLE